jgi:Leucine-rich repeat (LRR) protein
MQVLNLESNSLKELPSSLVRMQCLAVLNIDSNEIEYLPSDFQFPRLTEMSAEGNRLRDLPESIRDCKELRVLNLSRNNFSLYDFASLATKLPKLHTLTSESVRGAQTSGSSNAAASCSLP